MEIYIGDICYIYEYKNRKNIRGFSDLIKVKVDTVSDGGRDIIVSGEEMSGEYIVQNNNGVASRVSGIVVYKQDGSFLIKKNRKFYISYEKKSKGFDAVIKEVMNEKLYCIYACFKIDDNASVKLRLNNMCFESTDEVSDFLELVTVTHAQIYDDKVSFIMNKNLIEVPFYEVYMDGKFINRNSKEIVFKYACSSKNPINKEAYDFNKIFSMKLTGYEISTVNT